MAHILLPTDFSHRSLNACAYALDMFGTSGNVFTLVHAYMDPMPGYAEMVDMTSTLYAASVEGLAHFSERFRGLKGGADAMVFTEVVYGPLAGSINELCKAKKSVNLIVMGTQGATGTNFFGSSAGAVAKTSVVPVLIVPMEAQFQGLRHILLADDHHHVEPLAMRLLVKLARQFEADITIAHVMRKEEEPDSKVMADYEEIFAQVEYLHTVVLGDDVALALSNTAERDHMNLVAVLHRHTGFLDSLFHASVAKQLALHSHIPLLVLEH